MEFENQVKSVKRIIYANIYTRAIPLLPKDSECRTSFILDGQKVAISSRLSSRYQVDTWKAVYVSL